jgi:rhomboid protease GluP
MTESVDTWTGIYAAATRAECDERAFMLAAVGIASVVAFDDLQFSLGVPAHEVARGLSHLKSYEAERQVVQLHPPIALPVARVHGTAWVGSLIYVLVLAGVALAITNGLWPARAFDHGVLESLGVRAGQWWRAWTALTLHWDAPHLVANLGAGVWFGTLAARQLGSGWAWLLIVTCAAAANLFDARFGPYSYRSAGASTAVFAALGLMAAHAWRTRFHLPQRWALRWAPLFAGVVLLGWFGSAGEGTDLVAHALGFLVGGLIGAAAALPPVAAMMLRVPQWLAGSLALGSLATAWWYALSA